MYRLSTRNLQSRTKLFIEKVKRYLERINPLLTDDDFLELRASRYRYAQPICDPGYLDRLPPVSLPVEGLWVADTSYYYRDRGISEVLILVGKWRGMQFSDSSVHVSSVFGLPAHRRNSSSGQFLGRGLSIITG